ncbi:nitrate reductase alpha subunit [Paraburkholderia sp. WSM4177]|nr:nitrate reductase alpha subunit [Paraburkholderia sp. WSM4177]MBB5487695.1 nitrate reductase alpha subunit [Paraburkholderia sp. WSM4180]
MSHFLDRLRYFTAPRPQFSDGHGVNCTGSCSWKIYADWYNSTFIMMWGSNVPQTRTPDAHFMTEVRYKGAKIVSIFPDYAEGAKFGDIWLHPRQGTDAALALDEAANVQH